MPFVYQVELPHGELLAHEVGDEQAADCEASDGGLDGPATVEGSYCHVRVARVNYEEYFGGDVRGRIGGLGIVEEGDGVGVGI